MTKTIRNWNQAQRGDDKSTIDDETLEEMESALKPIDESSLVHAFIVPNYAEPEGLLRDTIKRLANKGMIIYLLGVCVWSSWIIKT
jgi:hypothetical protein